MALIQKEVLNRSCFCRAEGRGYYLCGFTRRVNNQNRSAGCESIFLCAVNWNEAAKAFYALEERENSEALAD